MGTIQKNTASFIIKYKWFIVASIPLLFIVFTISFLLSPQATKNNLPPNPSFPTVSKAPGRKSEIISEAGREDEISEDLIRNAQKETQPDGTVKYTIQSSNPQRPEVIIADNEGFPVFKRLVLPPTHVLSLSKFTQLYGQPEWIFKGSVFYGSDMRIYIYDKYGLALVVDPETNKILEQHLFTPMKVEEYVEKYGEDIPIQP